ncbi:MAG: hypothetical protein F2754_00395 [Actinobacteria bacterium]|nr:hypothetical protein [Actinomycetota bacterium]MSW91319.1 hypothetical protein [Actinomycetota bacterium]MSX85830.1 hypothetical protein [Actinomycetota bacterium]MSY70808.1 hypothetical protein [Actinomycetota bacterium]
MLFRRHQYAAIGRHELTCAFRRWKRPTVRTGGTLVTPVGDPWREMPDDPQDLRPLLELARLIGAAGSRTLP